MKNSLVRYHKGWAISHKFDSGWSLLGLGWFGWGCPPHADACRTAVFSTRKEARKALKYIRHGDWKFRIIKAKIVVLGI